MIRRPTEPSVLVRAARWLFAIGWVLLIALAAGAFAFHPDKFTSGSIAAFLREFETAALAVFLIFSVLRGFTLLPSTPLVLSGTLLFPHQPWAVLAVSLAGILASSAMIYWLSDVLGFAEYFEKRKPHNVAKIRKRLEHPAGALFVLLWAFFPLAPTDAICYVAGTMRMNFAKFIVAIFVGELVLCTIYVFGGSSIATLPS